MLRPRSIKQKLKWWVVVIFVLTGTAGWAGIWGLLYISRTTQEVTGEEVQRAHDAASVRADIASARRVDRDYLLALATRDLAVQEAVKRPDDAQVRGAWLDVAAHVTRLRDHGSDAPIEALLAAHKEVVTGWEAVQDAAVAGKGLPEITAGPFAEYERRVAELEKQSGALTEHAFSTTRLQTGRIYDNIWLLQIALFVTVLLCQIFSAWAGWRLSSSITGELAGLKDSAERISLGDLKNQVTVSTSDQEIVEVGEALDRLRVSLGKAMDRLAAKRAPRPAEG